MKQLKREKKGDFQGEDVRRMLTNNKNRSVQDIGLFKTVDKL